MPMINMRGTLSAKSYGFMGTGTINRGRLTFIGSLAATNIQRVIVSPDGNQVYAYCRGIWTSGSGYSSAKLYTFNRDTTTGILSEASSIIIPTTTTGSQDGYSRSFIISNDGKHIYLYCDGAGGVLVNRNTTTGILSGAVVIATTGIYMSISPDDLYVYVLGNGNVYIYNRNTTTGALSLLFTEPAPSPGSITGNSIIVAPDGLNIYTFCSFWNSTYYVSYINTYSRDMSTGLITYMEQRYGYDPTYYMVFDSINRLHVMALNYYNMYNRNAIGQLTYISSPSTACNSAIIAPDSSWIYTANTTVVGGRRYMSSSYSSDPANYFTIAGTYVSGICMSPDGKSVYFGDSGTVKQYSRIV